MVILSLGVVRGFIAGIVGMLVGMGLTMLIRIGMGLPAWSAGPVLAIGIIVAVVAYLIGLGALSYWVRWAGGARSAEEVQKAPTQPRPGWVRYFNFTTNHKVIGIQYIVTAFLFMLFAGSLAMLMRTELIAPGNQFLDPNTYNDVMSTHGITMLFFAVVPAVSGLVNYLLPLMLGARDMAFPRLNALSYWLLPPAGILVAVNFLGGGFDTGWTVYPPLSAKAPLGMELVLFGIYLAGFSSILGSINFLATIFKSRAPGMTLFRMPIFAWAVMATAVLQLGFTQFIAMSFLMVLFERVLGMGFFNPGMSGNVLLYQYLFWFYSHPAVYIFVLVGLGVISEILPVFVRKPLFGYKAVALSSLGIAAGGALVWGHHMFATGIPDSLRIFYMIATLIVAVPTGVKIFSWLGTMWQGKIRLATPLLFVLTAIVVFLIGGITGVPQGIVPVDLYLNNTYFIVGHFHATLFGGFVFPTMAAVYYWFPKIRGRMMSERLGKMHWAMMTLGWLVLYLPMFQLGLWGMRRRIATYDAASGFGTLNLISSIGGYIVFTSMVIFAFNLIWSAVKGPTAPSNPWGSKTLEWQVSSPPPEENFEEPPLVVGTPYGFGKPDAMHAIMHPHKEAG